MCAHVRTPSMVISYTKKESRFDSWKDLLEFLRTNKKNGYEILVEHPQLGDTSEKSMKHEDILSISNPRLSIVCELRSYAIRTPKCLGISHRKNGARE